MKKVLYARVTLLLLSLLLGAAVFGCDGGRANIFKNRPETMSPVALDGAVAYVSKTFEKAYLVSFDPSGNRPSVEVARVGRNPYAAFTSADLKKLLVICHGAAEGEVRKEDAQEESLTVVDTQGGQPEVYWLDSPFTGLARSASGRWAVAYFPVVMPGTNPNLMALVDLAQGPSGENPFVRDIRTLGSSVLSVVFLEDVDLAVPSDVGSTLVKKNFALALSESYVTLIDLDNPGRSEVSVWLTVPGLGEEVVPTSDGIILANDPAGVSSRVLLRSLNASDIFSITFIGVGGEDPEENDYRVSLNQLSVDVEQGASPADMALFEDGGRKLVLATNSATGGLVVLDPEATSVTPILTEFPVSSIMIFDEGRTALLYRIGSEMGYFLTLGGILERKELNLEKYSFGGQLSTFIPVPERNFAAFTLAEAYDRLFFINLLDRQMSVVYLSGSSYNAQFLMYPDGSHVMINPSDRKEVWFIRDMATYEIDRIIIDEPATGMWLLPGAGKVVLDHGLAEGYFTFLDMDDPQRGTAVSVWGFLFEDVLSLDPGDYPLAEQ